MEQSTTEPGAILVGRYRLEQCLGGGGAATVWEAHDLQADFGVALKLMHARLRVIERARARLEREARVLMSFRHPHIARALGLELEHDPPFIVLELIQGITLEEEMATRATLSRHWDPETFLLSFTELAEAVHYAHDYGVVHRDLKPSNVMLESTSGRLKILDFGIAKLLDSPERSFNTTRGRVLGSSYYMSPEQALGQTVDERSDVFALAVIAFEMLTLRRAWLKDADGEPAIAFAEPARLNEFNHPVRVLERIARNPRIPVSSVVDIWPKAVDGVLQRGLHLEREERFATPLELLEALQTALGTETPDRSDGVGWVAPTLDRPLGRTPTKQRVYAADSDPDVTKVVSDPVMWEASDGFESGGGSLDSDSFGTVAMDDDSVTRLREVSGVGDDNETMDPVPIDSDSFQVTRRAIATIPDEPAAATVAAVSPDASRTVATIRLPSGDDALGLAFGPRQPVQDETYKVSPSSPPTSEFEIPAGPTRETIPPEKSAPVLLSLAVALILVSGALGGVLAYGWLLPSAEIADAPQQDSLQTALFKVQADPEDPDAREALLRLLRRHALASENPEVQRRVLQLGTQDATLADLEEVVRFVSDS